MGVPISVAGQGEETLGHVDGSTPPSYKETKLEAYSAWESKDAQTEILRREASPAMRLLNELLNMHDGFDDERWLMACKKHMIDTFPREDPFSMLVPEGFDIDKLQGPLRPPVEADDVLLRVDFVREVDALLQEVRSKQSEVQHAQGLDPESVASRLKQQEKQQVKRQVEALLDLAVNLKW